VNCRVWVKDAIRTLSARGVLSGCSDVAALEEKIWKNAMIYSDQRKSGSPFSLYAITQA
jgi:hypothetical protein